MKIDKRIATVPTTIADVSPGDTFILHSDLYLMTSKTYVERTEPMRIVVRLRDGTVEYLSDGNVVTIVNTKVIRGD